MNTELRKKTKTYFENKKDFFNLMNKSVFLRKHQDIDLVTTEERRSYLVSEPNYHTAKFFSKNLLAIEMLMTQILMNNPVYLG